MAMSKYLYVWPSAGTSWSWTILQVAVYFIVYINIIFIYLNKINSTATFKITYIHIYTSSYIYVFPELVLIESSKSPPTPVGKVF